MLIYKGDRWLGQGIGGMGAEAVLSRKQSSHRADPPRMAQRLLREEQVLS
jgi:hypothetical protein